MAWDATDWTIDRATGNIRYTGDDHGGASPTYVTVIDFHRELQDLADDQESIPASGDEISITDQDPSARQTDNIIRLKGVYNIDDTAAEHLYDGSIIQGSGDTETIYDGIVNFGNSDVQIQIIQDGAVLADDWWNEAGAGLNPNAAQGISHRFMIKTRENGADIDGRRLIGTTRTLGNTYAEFRINGTSRGNNVLALVDATDLNNGTAEGTISGWTGITNTTEGYNGILIGGVTYFFYSEWNANLPTRSINDFYERMKWLTRDGSASTLYGINGELFRGITHQIVYDGATNGGPVELNYLAWGTTFNYDTELASGLTVGEYYTFQTSGAKGQLLALDDDGTTGFCVFAIQPGSGTVVNTEAFIRSDGTATDGASVNSVPVGTADVGGWGLVLADDASANAWIQIIKGVAPTDDMVMYETTSAGVHDTATDGTATVNVTVTTRTISTPFNGASTGSAIIGSYGFGVESGDLTQNDTLFDLTDSSISPPNNVTFSVNGLASGEDRVLVAPWDGSTLDNEGNPAIDKAQLTLNTALTGATETAVVATASIPSDTPSPTGTIRVEMDDSRDRYLAYTSFTGSTFTIGSTSFSGDEAAATNDLWISYLDKLAASGTESFTYVYDTVDRDFVVIVRDGGVTPIKEFISSASMSDTGGSITVIRTSDL